MTCAFSQAADVSLYSGALISQSDSQEPSIPLFRVLHCSIRYIHRWYLQKLFKMSLTAPATPITHLDEQVQPDGVNSS